MQLSCIPHTARTGNLPVCSMGPYLYLSVLPRVMGRPGSQAGWGPDTCNTTPVIIMVSTHGKPGPNFGNRHIG